MKKQQDDGVIQEHVRSKCYNCSTVALLIFIGLGGLRPPTPPTGAGAAHTHPAVWAHPAEPAHIHPVVRAHIHPAAPCCMDSHWLTLTVQNVHTLAM